MQRSGIRIKREQGKQRSCRRGRMVCCLQLRIQAAYQGQNPLMDTHKGTKDFALQCKRVCAFQLLLQGLRCRGGESPNQARLL